MTDNPLGQQIPTPSKYDPSLLYPIPRWAARSLLDIDKKVRMYGIDHWHAWEVSWLDEKGKPQVAIAELFFNAESENLIESKSLKLYLQSLNQEQLSDAERVQELIQKDLSVVSKSEIKVLLHPLDARLGSASGSRAGKSLDGQAIEIRDYLPQPELLRCTDGIVFDEILYSDLFRSNCPLTGAPDWASFSMQYTGPEIDEAGLLAYICSFRQHQAYHEDCAEHMYRDIMLRCQPTELTVALNFLRRGGLDINVYRSSVPLASSDVHGRMVRQ